MKTIVSEEGFAGIYHGLSPTILKVATAQATRFGVYMYIPAEYRKTPLGSAASGAFAGGVSVIIFQGLDVIKSRMQGLDAAKYTSSIHCLKELIANEVPRPPTPSPTHTLAHRHPRPPTPSPTHTLALARHSPHFGPGPSFWPWPEPWPCPPTLPPDFTQGIMALYKGVGPRMTRVCCEVCAPRHLLTHSTHSTRSIHCIPLHALRAPRALRTLRTLRTLPQPPTTLRNPTRSLRLSRSPHRTAPHRTAPTAPTAPPPLRPLCRWRSP